MNTVKVSITLLALLELLLASVCHAQSGDRDEATIEVASSGAITLAAEGPRPVASAIQAIVEKYGYIVTYEDPRYVYDGDLQDVSSKVRPAPKNGSQISGPKIIVPKGGELTIKSTSANASEVLGELVSAQSRAGVGARFRLNQANGFFHIIPNQRRDKSGNWAAQNSVLDVSISLPIADRKDYELIEAICNEITSASQVKTEANTLGLKLGMVDAALMPKYRLEAKSESARSVLQRALTAISANRGPMTWMLFYSNEPGYTKYVLNLLPVPVRSSPRAPENIDPIDPVRNSVERAK